ncbi:MAG: GTP-binding protein [Bacteroidota bacterium]|nr:GTP-binding protein [Bacteroidota bacterium]
MTINIEKKEIPVLLLTGYLGSGKTTLVNRILSNRKGIRFAVIVNDIGEVNIDADLIQKGGIVGQSDDSLVALQNGCICCTLKMDLVQQISDLTRSDRFDYIVIEASGICEPAPIAQTILNIPALGPQYNQGNTPVMDCIVTVVDALRMQSEFACGDDLTKKDLGEEDIERLLIEQIEFCNIVLLNKASEVTPEERGRIKEIIHALNPKATIFECDYGDIDLDRIVGTGMFDFDKVATSAAWIAEIEGDHDDDDDDDDDHDHEHEHEHEHEHHHHHHHDDEGEAEEYGIGTFVYYQRRPLDLNKFDYMVARKWPKSIIRAKGLCYFAHETDKCYLFEQAGVQKSLRDAGLWFATMPEEQLAEMMKRDKNLRRDWDEKYGDRMNKIVFIGQHLDKEGITSLMDDCLSDQDLS